MYVKCPICNLGSGYTVCCNHDKLTGEEVISILEKIKRFFGKTPVVYFPRIRNKPALPPPIKLAK
jgi:hypothetical protein